MSRATWTRRLLPLLTATFATLALAGPSNATDGSQILVKFRPGVTPRQQARSVEAANGTVVGRVHGLNVRIVRVPSGGEQAGALNRLRHDRHVAFAEVDARAQELDVIPNDYWWPNEWSQVTVEAPKAWAISTGAPSTVVAVLDTGVDPAQPDLQGAFVPGWNTLAGSANTSDSDGHGTLAAGVAVARGNNSIGVASYCWQCALMPVKVIDSGGAGSFSTVANGIMWATDHGARVISMSLGFSSSSSTLQSAVQYAHNHNVVIVAAAGNYGTSAPVYPAAYPEVLGVAGTDGSDQLYSWSTYGSWVKLAAPGCNFTTGRNAWYGTFCGTSSAAPALAGIAALAVSYAPLASNTQIEQALESSAVAIGSQVKYGRVDAYRTLAALGGGTAGTPSGTAPANTSLPAIAGTPQDGQTLSASSGSWTGTAPLGYGYQWRRCDAVGSTCSDISGAVAASYSATSADVGGTLRIVVTASNGYGTATATSSPTAVVAAAPVTSAPSSETATFSGSLNGKQTQQTFKTTVGSGTATAALSFSKSSSLTLTVSDGTGRPVGTASGPSVVTLIQTLAAGSYSFQVSGAGKSGCAFTLNVTYPVA